MRSLIPILFILTLTLTGCARQQISPEMLAIMKDASLITFEEVFRDGKLSKYYGEAGMCEYSKDYACAIELYELIVKYGTHQEERGTAECKLATLYRVGRFVEQNIELAKELAKSSCDRKLRCGCLEAQYIKELELK